MAKPTYKFRQLEKFLRSEMRMSAVYQPAMIRTLLEKNGTATVREIAAAFLALDEAQLEYYDEITKAMPGKVLARRGMVEKVPGGYRLAGEGDELTPTERRELLALCDERIRDFLEKRGKAAYDHRRVDPGDLSGSVRYEVLKRAKYRCELCGVSADERAIEVDHIFPRSRGGRDDITNFQALCYRCNTNKGARDSTDFRGLRDVLDVRQPGCLFCEMPASRVVAQNTLAYAIRDGFPVTPLHTLVIPKRHAATYFDLSEPERRAISILLDAVKDEIQTADREVSGFNIGMNCGETAGQTVMHAHVHLIPRRRGDVEKPRGGVRGVIPGKAAY